MNRSFLLTVFISYCFLAMAVPTNAQTPEVSFTNYSSRDGLSSATVYSIVKDRFGFLWFATEDGLNRFDGSNFRVYRHDPSNPRSLRVNHVTSIYEDKDGTLWVGTNGGGLSYYDRNKDSVCNYEGSAAINISSAITSLAGDKAGNIVVTGFGGLGFIDLKTKDSVRQNSVSTIISINKGGISTCFLEDSKKRKWVGTVNGLYEYVPGQNRPNIFQHQEGNSSSLVGNNINKLVEDGDGNIWIATETGLSKLLTDAGSGTFENITVSSSPSRLSSNIVYDLTIDHNNRIWIGTEEGLNILHIPSRSVSVYKPDSRNPRSISSRSIRSVFIDKQGIYWIGTFRGGINKYDENFSYFKVKEYNAFDPKGLRSPFVTAFADYNESVFVGTDGGGLQKYSPQTGLLDYISLPLLPGQDSHDLSVLALEITSDKKLWVGSFMNGLYRYDPATGLINHITKGGTNKDLNSNDIFCLKEDSRGNLWIGSNGGGVNIMNMATGLITKYTADPISRRDATGPASNYIKSFEEDTQGNIWVGTFGSGLSVYDPSTKKFRYYNKSNSGLPSNYIPSIKQDSRGNMWIGTNGNGIALMKKGSDQFTVLTEKDGLPNGIINQIVEDNAGKIWISTNNGISCYDPTSQQFKNYSVKNGLQAGSYIPRSGIRRKNGELFFGGQNGFNHFTPAGLKTNMNIPKIAFVSLKVDNQPVVPSPDGPIEQSILLSKEVKLHYKQAFSIGFEALDYTVPEANQYEYQLEGFDRSWVKAGKDHSAYYSNLPPGQYKFRVRASNNDGIWNKEGQSVIINVAPPFWRTVYAYIIYVLLIGGALYYMRRRAIAKIHQRFALEQERKNAKELIERQRKEAEYLHQLDQQKIKFLTNLSHEFRTPISLIIGPLESLVSQIKDEIAVNQLSLIRRNAKRLLNLVNQLLDFRKLEEKEIRLQASEGDLVAFMQDVCDSFNDLAKRKKISFGCHAAQTSIPALFDHNKVERILFNLLSNAFKFTPENGSITVEVNQLTPPDCERYITVELIVKDSGIGIPVEAQQHIFDSFFQHETSAEILNHGTGIGLSITKEFVKIHGGNIRVNSKPGGGTSFICEIRLKAIGETLSVDRTEQQDEGQGLIGERNNQKELIPVKAANQTTILVVEDDDDFRGYIKGNLEINYQVFEAANGKEGWQRALFHHPEIVICDIQMPVMNGLELVQKLKSDKRTKHVPVILLTAANTPEGLLNGLETGAIDYMTKPFDFAVLQAKITNILQLNQSMKDTYSKQVTVGLPEVVTISEKDKFLQKALDYIYKNLDNPQLSVEALSDHLYMSRASLYSRLIEYTGKSPVDFIRSVKLEKAKELLEKSDLTVTEISYEAGFANPTYFTKVFKTHFKMTPSEYQSRKVNK